MQAVSQRPPQAVTRLPPSPFRKHRSGAREKEGALVTAWAPLRRKRQLIAELERLSGMKVTLQDAV
jgi:hypothetical protein